MEDALENTLNDEQLESLEIEVKRFADALPYWAKYIADKILSGKVIVRDDIEISYGFLLQELKLAEETNKPEIAINYNPTNSGSYKPDLILKNIENVEGVNALSEKQKLEFNDKLTIVYGNNGSGKSGYVRLLKKAFYSKAPEEILQNIYVESGHKSISAMFNFSSNGTDIPFTYPSDIENSEFEQFAVFDGKSVIKHLDQRNEFEFRPSGLSFFSEFNEAIKSLEARLNIDLSDRKVGFPLTDIANLFEGESTIKKSIENLDALTNIESLKLFTPFSEEDKLAKSNLEKQYDELLLASKSKEKEIKSLENLKKLLGDNKRNIETLNLNFTKDYLSKIEISITDCNKKEDSAKKDGIESFKTDKIEGVGSDEWKDFIFAAEKFALNQKQELETYPENGDNCLLCHQPLDINAQELIAKYWAFVKSAAELDANKAREVINNILESYEKLSFELFPEENVLSVWLNEKYPILLNQLKKDLKDQKLLSENIISDLKGKTTNPRIEYQIATTEHDSIEKDIDELIKLLNDDEQNKELERLIKEKTHLIHKEKINLHYEKIKAYWNNKSWIKRASEANFAKRKITDTEKYLSNKYFNQQYVEAFNEECKKLNGSFGIEISHTGADGKSFRQLKLKGKNPHAILSEGEQKVIAIADFIAEMSLSEINRGIFFDDPVTSLDEKRKSEIAKRLVEESSSKQVIVFTHDLVFVSSLIGHCKELEIDNDCHWIENIDGNQPGTIWLKNTPSYEKEYKTSGKAQEYYNEAKKAEPNSREDKIKNGFAALRTSYETQVVFGLFKGVVQRFEERVSVDSLSSVYFTSEIRDELLDSFHQCCRYMEGHSHSDKYAYKKPELENLNEEIQRFNTIKQRIKDSKP